jgi:hypothetical protein
VVIFFIALLKILINELIIIVKLNHENYER